MLTAVERTPCNREVVGLINYFSVQSFLNELCIKKPNKEGTNHLQLKPIFKNGNLTVLHEAKQVQILDIAVYT